MGSFSVWHWLIVFLIIALIFGTKKLRNIGTDLGSAVKGFKEGMNEAEHSSAQQTAQKIEQSEMPKQGEGEGQGDSDSTQHRDSSHSPRTTASREERHV